MKIQDDLKANNYNCLDFNSFNKKETLKPH